MKEELKAIEDELFKLEQRLQALNRSWPHTEFNQAIGQVRSAQTWLGRAHD